VPRILIGAGRVPSPNDSKARIGYYLDAEMPGHTGEALRGLMRAAYTLTQTATHSSSIGRVDAFAAAQATLLIVRTLQKLDA
jgi:hypothetical protein